MHQFLPYLKSKELEQQFRNFQSKQNRNYFIILCVVEIINFSYGFGVIIQEGIINSQLVASYVTMILSYVAILLFIYKNLKIEQYLIPLIQCFYPLFRWIKTSQNITINQQPDLIQGMINSPYYFFKTICIIIYLVLEILLQFNDDTHGFSYVTIIVVFTLFMLKQLMEDQRNRQNFLSSQRLFMWQQLIDKYIQMSFFAIKPKKKQKTMDQIYSNTLELHTINKHARMKHSLHTSEKLNSFLERIQIIDEDDDNFDDGYRSRILSEKMSSNRLMSMSKNRQSKKTLLSECHRLIEANQNDKSDKNLSQIQICTEFTGIIQPQKQSYQSKKQDSTQSNIKQNQENSDKIQKAQPVQIKLYYYNITEDYLIIQIEEEDFKLKAKKQREEHRKALAFRDKLTFRMKNNIENLIYNVKLNFGIFKQLPNYKNIMFEMYQLKQYQQNIISTFTDFGIQMPYESCQVNLKQLVTSLYNLFSDSNEKSTISNEIFCFQISEEMVQTQPTWLNCVLFNLMINSKQHGANDSEIQIKISQDQLDQNLINIDVVNEITEKNEEQLQTNIHEMTKIQNQEDLFNYYYQKQKQLDSITQLNQIVSNIDKKANESAEKKQLRLIQDSLKYTLGIFVSRLSLKKIGPSGVISYSLSKNKDKSFLIASIQIYKDIEEIHRKEKDNFTETFGKNQITANNGITYSNLVQKRIITDYMQQSYMNSYRDSNQYDRNYKSQYNESSKKEDLFSNEALNKNILDGKQSFSQRSNSNKRTNSDLNQNKYSKVFEMVKDQDQDQNQQINNQTIDESPAQNQRNQIINNHMTFQSEHESPLQIKKSQIPQPLEKTPSVVDKIQQVVEKIQQPVDKIQQDKLNVQSPPKNSRSSIISNSNSAPQKSQFYRDQTYEDQKNKDNQSNKIKQHQEIQSTRKCARQLSGTSDISEFYFDSEDDNMNTFQMNVLDYQLNCKRTPRLFSSILEEQHESGSAKQTSNYQSYKKDHFITNYHQGSSRSRQSIIGNEKIESSQLEDQNILSTPVIYYQKPLIQKTDFPFLQNQMLDD